MGFVAGGDTPKAVRNKKTEGGFDVSQSDRNRRGR